MDLRIQTVLTLIKRNIRCTPKPREMAGEVKLSLSRFYDLFRQETGTVPARYIRGIRFEKAQELLVNSNLSVKEIADLVGIHDVSHFVRDFQNAYGLSPRVFRRTHGFVPLQLAAVAEAFVRQPENRLINSDFGQ